MNNARLIIIDSAVIFPTTLLRQLNEGGFVLLLEQGTSPLKQITDAVQALAAQGSRVDTLDLLSHGGDSFVVLGGQRYDAATMHAQMDELAALGSQLAPGAGRLLYGCNVAEHEAGFAFINALSQATGGQVAASTNATGVPTLCGDCVLEGWTATGVAVPPGLSSYPELLAVPFSLNFDQVLVTGGDSPGKSPRLFDAWTGRLLATEGTDARAQLSGRYLGQRGYAPCRFESWGAHCQRSAERSQVHPALGHVGSGVLDGRHHGRRLHAPQCRACDRQPQGQQYQPHRRQRLCTARRGCQFHSPRCGLGSLQQRKTDREVAEDQGNGQRRNRGAVQPYVEQLQSGQITAGDLVKATMYHGLAHPSSQQGNFLDGEAVFYTDWRLTRFFPDSSAAPTARMSPRQTTTVATHTDGYTCLR